METGFCLSAVLWTYCPAAASELRKMLGVEEHPGRRTRRPICNGNLQELVVTAPDGFYARGLFAGSGTPKRVTIAIPAQDQTAEAFFATSEAPQP